MKRLTPWLLAGGFGLFLSLADADVDAWLFDLAIRIDYGYYASEPALIDAATQSLAAAPGNDPWAQYFLAYAAMRRAQLDLLRRGHVGQALDSCISAAEEATESETTAAEAWVLVAACSTLAAAEEPIRSVLHQRRADQALSRAAGLNEDNPRLLLVAAWQIANDAKDSDAKAQATVRAALETALAAFAARGRSQDLPDWGEAETSLRLGRWQMQHGDMRAARDYVERALLIAPDYRTAIDLRSQLGLR